MTKYSTEDLILYIYKETTAEQTSSIERAIQEDWTLKEKYEALKASMQGLNSIVSSPRPQSIKAILDYAKATAEVAES